MVTPWHAIFANRLKGGRRHFREMEDFFLSFCSHWSQCLSREDVTSSYCPHVDVQLVPTANSRATSRGLAHTCTREGACCYMRWMQSTFRLWHVAATKHLAQVQHKLLVRVG